MSRTSIDIDDAALECVMARALRGSGWGGNLEQMDDSSAERLPDCGSGNRLRGEPASR